MTALESYPFRKHQFKTEIGGVTVAGFNEVTGFDTTPDFTEYTYAINKPRKQPGLEKYGNITV